MIDIQKKSDRTLKILAPVILIIGALVLWEVLINVTDAPKWMIAKPTEIFNVLFSSATFRTEIWPDAWVTIKTLLLCYPIAAVLGIGFAGLTTNSELVNSAVNPYVILLICTPMMTLVPLLMVLMGFGIGPRYLVVILQSFPIINMNCATGFLNVPTERIELMQSLKASRISTFFRVTIPSSLNNIFIGLRIGFIVCINSCIAAEFAGGNAGLGAGIITHTTFNRIPLAFACIVMVTIIGVIGYSLIGALEKAVYTWKET